MKKLLLCMLLIAAMSATAREKKDDTKYMAGAVPEVNGIVTFKKSFSVTGKTPEEVSETMRNFVKQMVDASITAPGNYARIVEETPEGTVARVCEWLVFKKKALNLDRARMRYQIKVETQGTRITITLAHIIYYYGEDMEGNNGAIIKAEEWITDKEALNKSQTKLYPKSGKFRRKTVDRAEEIFNAAMDAFETKEEVVVPVKPVRKNIVED